MLYLLVVDGFLILIVESFETHQSTSHHIGSVMFYGPCSQKGQNIFTDGLQIILLTKRDSARIKDYYRDDKVCSRVSLI
jgi:hypothetical protein